jgi:hypothetical protein
MPQTYHPIAPRAPAVGSRRAQGLLYALQQGRVHRLSLHMIEPKDSAPVPFPAKGAMT